MPNQVAIDTNVLVRCLIDDGAHESSSGQTSLSQTKQAKQLVQKCIQHQIPIFIDALVLIETVWVAKSVFKLDKPQQITLIEQILKTKQFNISNRQGLFEALLHFAGNPCDYSDSYIFVQALKHGNEAVYSFDKKAIQSGMKAPLSFEL